MNSSTLFPVVETKQTPKRAVKSCSQKEVDVIFNEDCKSGLCKVRDEFVNLIVTDPPFAIDF